MAAPPPDRTTTPAPAAPPARDIAVPLAPARASDSGGLQPTVYINGNGYGASNGHGTDTAPDAYGGPKLCRIDDPDCEACQ